MGETSIEWTDRTWNPVRGCSRVSEGCRNCYAERIAARFSKGRGAKWQGEFQGFAILENGKSRWTGKVELIEPKLSEPLHWRKPCRVFVNSMSDLFHEALPDEAIDRAFAVMVLAPQHTFQVLTKRPKRMLEHFGGGSPRESLYTAVRIKEQASKIPNYERLCEAADFMPWPFPNVWLGVSVEDQKTADERIPLLLRTPAAKRFVSYEPALGPVDFREIWPDGLMLPGPERVRVPINALTLHDEDRYFQAPAKLDWIIVGGESGPGARPFDIDNAWRTIAQCKAAGVACFMKQFGAALLGDQHGFLVNWEGDDQTFGLYDRKGGDPSEWPEWARVREYPQ